MPAALEHQVKHTPSLAEKLHRVSGNSVSADEPRDSVAVSTSTRDPGDCDRRLIRTQSDQCKPRKTSTIDYCSYSVV
jgi:hypothetical protein